MSSLPNKFAWLLLVLGAFFLLSGCIADSAEDSDLPWASDHGWENMMLLPTSMTDRYD